MLTRDILKSHSVSTLKKEISKTNVKGYSKMKKAEVIDLMMKAEHTDKFKHIKMAEKKERKTPVKKTPVKKTPVKKETHKMPDGSLMTGATHSKDSVPVKSKKKPKKKLPLKDGKVQKPISKNAFMIRGQPLTMVKGDGSIVVMRKRDREKAKRDLKRY